MKCKNHNIRLEDADYNSSEPLTQHNLDPAQLSDIPGASIIQ